LFNQVTGGTLAAGSNDETFCFAEQSKPDARMPAEALHSFEAVSILSPQEGKDGLKLLPDIHCSIGRP
jgi:hypothetical protein